MSVGWLAVLDEEGIRFLALRQRNPKLMASIGALPGSSWKKVTLDRSGPYRHPEAHEDAATVRRCPRPLRQIAVRGLGREHPHLDALSSAVALNVDLDATLTVWAQVADDALRRRLPGYQKAGPDTLWRRFVSTRGRITIDPAEVVVRPRSRTHSPVMRSANVPVVDVPWWGGRPLRFELD